MSADMGRARVFISCGQRAEIGETEIAVAIADALADEGFDPYLATAQQTLRGLKENIFDRLADAEYFLFVDFRRERLLDTPPPNCRGSVFSQQELALAAYLDIETIVFQEQGIRPLEGILQAVQANAAPFSERESLPGAVIAEVRRRGWDATRRMLCRSIGTRDCTAAP